MKRDEQKVTNMSHFIKGGYLDPIALSNRLNERMLDTKKVSRAVHDKSDILYALQLIEVINQLPDYVESYMGFRFDEIRIPKFLAPFVWPKKVSFKPDVKYSDLRRVRRDLTDVPVDLGRLKGLTDCVNSEFKCDIAPVAISELRSARTLDEVRFCVTEGEVERVIVDGAQDYFIPIPVISQILDVVGVHVVNEDAEYIVKLFLDYMRFDS